MRGVVFKIRIFSQIRLHKVVINRVLNLIHHYFMQSNLKGDDDVDVDYIIIIFY